MDAMVEIPAIPAGVMIFLGFFSPYALALVNQPKWSSNAKRLITVGVTILLALIALGAYYLMSGEPIPNWPTMVLLFLVVSQTSYSLVTKKGASNIERNTFNFNG